MNDYDKGRQSVLTEQSVEGWRNAATYQIALAIDNDREHLEGMVYIARRFVSSSKGTDVLSPIEHATSRFRDWIRSDQEAMVEAWMSQLGDEESAIAGLLQSACNQIDWMELAKHYIWKAIEQAEYEETTEPQTEGGA